MTERHGGQAAAAAPLTIVGYHYVRPVAAGCYPRLNGLEVAQFQDQMRYFNRHYTFVSIEDVVASVEGGAALPARPLLLTFDDGYLDHFEYAWPILREFGARGAFYPAAMSARGHSVLDANKIHFVLASLRDPEVLVDAVERAIIDAISDPAATIRAHRERHWSANRFDAAPVMYCKRLLQFALPEAIRRQTLDALFRRLVTEDERSFAADLYMGVDELQELLSAGMHVGGHGGRHAWLDRLGVEEQRREIADSLHLLREVWNGDSGRCLTYCYPYGGYNDHTLALLREQGCRAGLTVRPGLACLGPGTMLELPRLDTSDFPTDAEGPPWTLDAPEDPPRTDV